MLSLSMRVIGSAVNRKQNRGQRGTPSNSYYKQEKCRQIPNYSARACQVHFFVAASQATTRLK
jgi:hypothetical protein